MRTDARMYSRTDHYLSRVGKETGLVQMGLRAILHPVRLRRVNDALGPSYPTPTFEDQYQLYGEDFSSCQAHSSWTKSNNLKNVGIKTPIGLT